MCALLCAACGGVVRPAYARSSSVGPAQLENSTKVWPGGGGRTDRQTDTNLHIHRPLITSPIITPIRVNNFVEKKHSPFHNEQD